MKKYLSICLLSLASAAVSAQSPIQQSVTIAIGSGISTTSSALKKDAQIGNGYQINGSVFIPFFRKGWDGSVKGSGKFALGIIAGGEYNSAQNLTPDAGPAQAAYKLVTGNLDIASAQKGSANSTGFNGSAGLQADFTLGKITISPSLSGAYFSLTQDGFAQSGQVMVNGTTQTVVLLESSPAKRTGFITRPQLKVSYPLTANLSFYAAGALNMGPNVTSNESQLVPSGGFNAKNTYEAMQLTTGTRANQTVETRFQTIAVNVGLSWSFGSAGNSSRRLRGKVTKPGDGGMRSSALVPAVVTPAEPANAQATTDEQRTYTGGRKNEPANSQATAEEHRTYTGGRKNETSALATGNPIGGLIVKGGKNPGGSNITAITNDNGEIELKGLEAGNYKFTVTAPEEPAGKSINEKGIKRSEENMSGRLSMTPTTTKQTQGANFGEKVAGGLQSGAGAVIQGASKGISEKGVSSTKGRPQNMVYTPGQPISGTVVKGGKNPAGSMMVLTTNDKGEFELNGIEAGDYKFTITAPAQPAKGHSEKGIK